jgi:hypothetical protein
VANLRNSRAVLPSIDNRTQATTVSLCTSRPAQPPGFPN